jgi:arylformamidase
MAWITRRAALAGGTALAIGGAALAQPAPAARAKGPLVWLDMDQKELDDA